MPPAHNVSAYRSADVEMTACSGEDLATPFLAPVWPPSHCSVQTGTPVIRETSPAVNTSSFAETMVMVAALSLRRGNLLLATPSGEHRLVGSGCAR
jgi:hypothetical protein